VDLAREFHLHLFNPSAAPAPALRREYDASAVTSKRRRPFEAARMLRNYGARIRVLELQGDLVFSTVEPVLRELVKQAPYARHVILDCRRVTGATPISLKLLTEFATQLAAADPSVRLVYSNVRLFTRELVAAGALESCIFTEVEGALESSEDLLLAELCGPEWHPPQVVALGQCQLLRECPPQDIEWLEKHLPVRRFAVGEAIVLTGDKASEMFFISSGSVEVCLRRADGQRGARVDVFTAGMSFGEMAFLDSAPRSADVVALGPVECRVLDHGLFTALEHDRPQLKIALLMALARMVSANLRRTNIEVAALRY
jgi:glutaminase